MKKRYFKNPGFWLFLAILFFISFPTPAEVPEKVFAPYVDVLLYPAFSVNDAFDQTGQPYYTLAFITAGTDCNPAWGGVIALEEDYYLDEINALRQRGGDVIISFGGASGTELAMCHNDANTLQAAYQSVIDQYQVTWVDFDIEGWAVAHRASIDLRNKAIQGLQAANPHLTVAYCLPVLPSGLTRDSLYVLENALANGVRVDVVNVMAMDYGDGAAPDPEGNMGRYAIDAAVNTYAQARSLGLDPLMGITPMIGQNDVSTERFYLSDAEELLAWAASTDRVTMLSMWSAGRDNGQCADKQWADPTCSGIAQADFAFTDIFAQYNGGTPGNISPRATLTDPAEGTRFESGETVTITADAVDSDGTVVRVEFLVDGESLGVVRSAPYTLWWTQPSNGIHTIMAVATDDQGAAGRSDTLQITVGGGTALPAWDPSEVYWGGDEVSHEGKSWRAKWWTRGEEPGTTGEWGVWEETGWCDGNSAPTITLASPINGDTIDSGATITLVAVAADSDGTVLQVEFFADGESLGSVGTSPYTLDWVGAADGTHVIIASATDDDGAVEESAAIQITVGDATPTTPQWRATEIYWGGDRVCHNGKLWRAKWWTQGEEPGTTGRWGVWEEGV